MATKKKGDESEGEETKEGIKAMFPDGMLSTTVKATEKHPFLGKGHAGKEIKCSVAVAKKMIRQGWAEKAVIVVLLVVGLLASQLSYGQATNSEQSLKSVYSLNSDTVTNTATVTLTTAVKVSSFNSLTQQTTVQVNVTKISGTVGGTISLLGSLDGTNYKALNTIETQTALATITATDATNVYHWRLTGSPFLYYRVSWTGTGTMSASFTAKLVKH